MKAQQRHSSGNTLGRHSKTHKFIYSRGMRRGSQLILRRTSFIYQCFSLKKQDAINTHSRWEEERKTYSGAGAGENHLNHPKHVTDTLSEKPDHRGTTWTRCQRLPPNHRCCYHQPPATEKKKGGVEQISRDAKQSNELLLNFVCGLVDED